jgi:hypothetical protein
MKYFLNQNAIASSFAAVVVTIGVASNAQALTLLGSALPQTATVKLWMVPLDTSAGAPHPGDASGVNAVFPVPAATPDLTFGTNLIQFTAENKPNTIQGFFVPGSVINPVFSNVVNPQVGAIVDANTLLTNGGWQTSSCAPGSCWGTFMEILGSVLLEDGGHVKIEHDDGVSLMLNGTLTNCFADPDGTHYLAANLIQSCTYNGPSGLVPFDLVYTEGFWVPVDGVNTAKLSFAVPEPGSFALIGLGLFFAGIAGASRRRQRC